jgi:hypothetical protein
MDNFRIDITSEGDIAPAMKIAFRDEHTRAVAYRVDAARGLIFYQYPSKREGVVALPFKLDHADAAHFAKRWLSEQDYGREPDHDGDNERGWRLYNEDWGHIASEHETFVAVKPAWAMYGK